ncbi:hypothetical protein RND81_02G198400 [Saponaria officinalis]|uniref:Uncharacterized protein n=1 Tax=Saponaria officinalis TaxID=3572 RepID=A0AAW1MZ54_SAPOF
MDTTHSCKLADDSFSDYRSPVAGEHTTAPTKLPRDCIVGYCEGYAARALKLQEHEAAKDLCSLVLSYFPLNVKALFRRASAFMSMKLYLEAESDIEKAMLVEPKNKDIIRELNVVKNYLVIKSNGKRSMETQSQQDEIREGKKPNHTPIFELERTTEKDGYSSSGSCSNLVISNEGDNLNYLNNNSDQSDTTYSPSMVVDTTLEMQHDNANQKSLFLFKKGKKTYEVEDLSTNLSEALRWK